MLFGKEKVIVPENKTNLILEGKGYLNTFLSWNETAGSRRGTFYRFSVNIPASNFIAYNLSFQRVRCRESSIEIPITEECYILLFSLCWCKECRNYTCSKHICGGIPSFEKSFMLEGIPVINWEQRRGGNAWQRLDNGPFLLLQYYSYLLMWDLVCL
nr:uncharacterized protein LOC107429770 isoform X1 [Ziziphus jujuba var. spinosa]